MRKLPRALLAGAGVLLAARHLPKIAVKVPGVALAVAKSGYGMLADRGAKVLNRGGDDDTAADEGMVARLDEVSAPPPADDAPTGEVLAHDELPLPDYDHLTLGSLRARVRKLDAAEVEQLRDYERAHANRMPVIVLFENRLRSLAEAEEAAPATT